jgi:hypothetical protein
MSRTIADGLSKKAKALAELENEAKFLGINDKADNSDQLDGLNSTQFLRSDTNDTATGDYTFTGNLLIDGDGSNGLILNDNSGSPTDQSIILRAESINAELPDSLDMAVVFDNNTDESAHEIGVISVGEFYAQSNRRVYHDAYHPNADQLNTARTISLSGDASGSVSFDGSGNVSIPVVIADGSHNHDSQYLGINAKADDSELLDGLNSTQLLRSDTQNSSGFFETIILDNAILSKDDGNTYIQFHQPDQFRVVTGNIERFEVSNTTTTVGTDLVVAGDLTVNGTTTQLNTTVTTLEDPIITLADNTSIDDNKDRGVEFKWHDAAGVKTGFFGYNDSEQRFSFIPDGTNSSEVFAGTLGDAEFGTVYAALEGTASNATLLDGYSSSQSPIANTVAVRDSGGDVRARLLRSDYNTSSTISGGMVFRVNTGDNNYLRTCDNVGAIRTFIDTYSKSESDANYLGKTAKAEDSEKIDGINSTQLVRSDISGTINGTLTTTGDLIAGQAGRVEVGRGSGALALTMNDGYGNTNIAFNHSIGIPDQDGNAARISVNTDATSAAEMIFSLKNNVTSGVQVTTLDIMSIKGDGVEVYGDVTATNFIGSADDSKLLDGLNSSQFLRADTADTAAGRISFSTDIEIDGIVLSDSADRTGLLEITRKDSSSWTGIMTKFSSSAEWALMGNEGSFGLYDDQENEWIWQAYSSGSLHLNYVGVSRLSTTSAGIDVNGDLTVAGDAFIQGSHLKVGNVVNSALIELDTSNAGSPQINMSDNGGDNRWAIGADDADNNFAIHGSTTALPTINNITNPHFEITTSGVLYATGNKIWHAGNDGSGSGLDADKLDGLEGSSYLRSNSTDYINSTLYMRDDLISETGYRDHGIFGTYDRDKTQHIWSMGTQYRCASDGSDLGNLYGIAYDYNANGVGHGFHSVQNGSIKASIGTNIWTSGNVTAYSDIRVKENLELIPDAVAKISELNGYTYDRTDIVPDELEIEYDSIHNPSGRHVGLIAQEVLKVLPEAVTGGPTTEEGTEDDHYSVAYGNVVALLVEGIKEQQKVINKMQIDIEKLMRSK